MSFYKRSFHSFLNQTNTKTMPFESGLGHDKIMSYDETNGLMLCTEYLGFESYDMRMSENEVVENKMMSPADDVTERVNIKRRKTEENVVAEERKNVFPPPLSSLNGRGQRSFYLQPVRKDGRLKLTQVMINRPEILCSSRKDGRLRLHLVDGVENPIKAYGESEELVDLTDEPKSLDNDHEGREISIPDNKEDNDSTANEMVELSNDTKSWCDVSVNLDDDVTKFQDHDMREWRYSCHKFVESMNQDEKNDHHQYHSRHPYYHQNCNNDMHLCTRAYVKTR